MRLIHGLEVHPSSSAERPAYLCYTPDWEEIRNGRSFWFEGDHVGAVVHDEETECWYPVDTDWWPMDAQGEAINTTFGTTEEHRAEMQFFERRADAVRFLAHWWNLRNPSNAVRMEVAA